MLTLLGSLLGFGSSFLPKILDFFQDRSDKKQELKILELQMQATREQHNQRITEINVEGDIREMEALHRGDRDSGVPWIEGLRASVRPIITYAFFFLFVAIKITAMLALRNAGDEWHVALNAIWTPQTEALFAAVMSFWFGGRAVKHFWKR